MSPADLPRADLYAHLRCQDCGHLPGYRDPQDGHCRAGDHLNMRLCPCPDHCPKETP